MSQTMTDYGYRTKLDLPYEEALQKVTGALKEEALVC